jgi:hypothetical protein
MQKMRNEHGSALLIIMVMMFLTLMATTGILMLTANALYLNRYQRTSATAFNVAESGAGAANSWLMNQPSPPNGTAPLPQITGTIDDGDYTVTIYPDSHNTVSYLKTYRLVSIGRVRGKSKTVEVVVRQSSFGRYAYFTDKETSSVSGGAIWWKAGEVIDGPAHSNNTSGTNFQVNYNASTSPIFLDMVTASGSTINYTPTRPTTEPEFKKVFLNGSKGYMLGVPPIPLPASTEAQKNASWGSVGGFPTGTSGVYLRSGSNGGIYIQGDATLTLSLDAGGNQVFTVNQGLNTTTVTLNKSSNAVTTSGPMGTGSPTTAGALGTGVIYCSGNITSLKGEVADNRVSGGEITTPSAFTIATDVNAGKYIKITDNLVYHTKPDKTKDATAAANLAAGTLGLVAEDIRISSSAPRNLEIDAVCLAGGQNTGDSSFYVENYASKSPTGTLTVLGGIIQKSRGPVGTFNPSTGQTQTGYAKSYHYDPRLASKPPPYYPTTGQYERLSWQVLSN